MIVDVPGIPLRRRGEPTVYAQVSAEDFVWLNDYRWTLSSKGYAQRTFEKDGRWIAVLMHREILGLEPGDGLEGDHHNGDKLDNRRTNLRITTRAENGQNLRHVHGGTSRHRGVYFSAKAGKWCASAKLRGVCHHLGTFDTEDEAAAAASAWRQEHMPFSNEAAAA